MVVIGVVIEVAMMVVVVIVDVEFSCFD